MVRRFIVAKALEERGQGLVLAAFAMLAILGFAALAVDAGVALQERRQLQGAADAAALAGAADLGVSASAAIQTAMDYVERNGIDPDDPDMTVQVTTPYEGDPGKIEVTISREVDFLFAPALGINSAQVGARAVAESSGAGGGGWSMICTSGVAGSGLGRQTSGRGLGDGWGVGEGVTAGAGEGVTAGVGVAGVAS